jgi:hypothetical protein
MFVFNIPFFYSGFCATETGQNEKNEGSGTLSIPVIGLRTAQMVSDEPAGSPGRE